MGDNTTTTYTISRDDEWVAEATRRLKIQNLLFAQVLTTLLHSVSKEYKGSNICRSDYTNPSNIDKKNLVNVETCLPNT